jgi:hypothetical protein
MVLQKKVVFLFYRSFKNKAIASGILKKLQIFVKLRLFKLTSGMRMNQKLTNKQHNYQTLL